MDGARGARRNLTICEAFGCSHVSGLFSNGGLTSIAMLKCRQNDTLPSKAKYFPSNVLASVQHDHHLFLAKKSDQTGDDEPRRTRTT
jgi:hypothetical protein